MNRQWRSTPPLPVMVAAYLGIKTDRNDEPPERVNDDAALLELMSSLPPLPEHLKLPPGAMTADPRTYWKK